MANDQREWLRCNATYHGGASYWIRGVCFKRNIRTPVSDPKMRKKLSRIKGMSIEDVFRTPEPVEVEEPATPVKKVATSGGKKRKKLKKKKVA